MFQWGKNFLKGVKMVERGKSNKEGSQKKT